MYYYLKGKVIQGDGWGKKMGYPTANLDRRYFVRHPVPKGVWACWVRVKKGKAGKAGEKVYRGVAVIGVKNKVEVHILDFQKNMYGWHIEAELVKRLRDIREYSSRELLTRQIKKDIITVRAQLS